MAEKRLIDAEAVSKRLKDESINQMEQSPDGRWDREARAFADAWRMVKDAPTIDAVEVVRCRDCKHLLIFGRYPVCLRDENLVDEPPYVELQDFCSYGERREDKQ